MVQLANHHAKFEPIYGKIADFYNFYNISKSKKLLKLGLVNTLDVGILHIVIAMCLENLFCNLRISSVMHLATSQWTTPPSYHLPPESGNLVS